MTTMIVMAGGAGGQVFFAVGPARGPLSPPPRSKRPAARQLTIMLDPP